MSLGSILKEARERKGLTIAQVAEQTRMIHQLVEEIENDDFHRITAPLYGRGFVKLFAECVGEDPAPLVQEFTEIYSGLRRPGVRTRPVQTPVERSDVAEPKDRNAPPPRPKVRHVIVADDPEEVPAASATDAPTTRPIERPVETSVPAAADAAPPADAPTARPSERPVETSVPAAADAAPDKDAPTTRPSERFVETSVPVVADPAPDKDAPTARPSERSAETSVPVASEPVENPNLAVQASEQSDEGLLGDLFDLVARKRPQRSDETDASAVKGESSVKIALPQKAPSWDDAPFDENGDFWQRLYRFKFKYWKISAALAGLFLLALIVFGVVANRHSKPEEAETPDAPKATAISDPQPEPIPAELSAPTQTPAPSSDVAGAASEDGRTVYTANLIPPPDSYVE
jgi:hypothetical protein